MFHSGEIQLVLKVYIRKLTAARTDMQKVNVKLHRRDKTFSDREKKHFAFVTNKKRKSIFR